MKNVIVFVKYMQSASHYLTLRSENVTKFTFFREMFSVFVQSRLCMFLHYFYLIKLLFLS